VICWLKQTRWTLIGIVLAGLVTDARALDPNRLPSQYVREQWTTETRFPGGVVNGVAQTTDGYLWIGTDRGLIRFDGFNFRPVSLTSIAIASNVSILQLLTDAGGKLWIRPQGADLVRQKDGKFESVRYGPNAITALSKDNHDGVLVSDIEQGTFRFVADSVQKLGPASPPVISLAETADGKIWLGTLGDGLFFLAGARASQVNAGLPDRKINCLLAIGSDELWVGTDRGLYRGNGKDFRRVELPSFLGNVQVLSLLRDHDSNMWVGTTRGLLRINGKGISFSEENDLRGDGAINALFEDREGNIWVGGTKGLERIRDSTFLTYSAAVGLPSDHTGPVYVDHQDRTWFAPSEGGLYLLSEGRVKQVRVPGLRTEVVYSISGGNDGSIWIGRQHGGVTRLQFDAGILKHQDYTAARGLTQNSVYSVYQARDGSAWAGTLSGGVSRLKDGKFITYTAANGLGANTVAAILQTQDGTMWFATPNGLSTFSNGQWKTYTRADGLPAEDVNCLYQASSGILWIGTSGGLAFFKSGLILVPGTAPASLREEIFGIAEDRKKGLWIATSRHVLRAQSEQLLSNVSGPADVREYWVEDGLLGLGGVKRNVSVTADSSQRIWFSLSRGLSVVDASHVTDSLTPAMAHIEGILADGKPMPVLSGIRIPSSQKRVTFSFTGLSLAVPEHVRFSYMLDPFDRGWSEPVAAREAVYTNLSPGDYRFRVVASNSAGVWNGVETNLAFEVEPALWQTWWFRLAGVAAAGSLIVFLYRLRLHTLTRQLNFRFEERLAERTRIAQELHDTLLQGALSASMQLNVANDRLESNSPAKPLITRVLELMGHVVEDGRHALHGLRLSTGDTEDLGQAFSRIPAELLAQDGADFRVVVEGSSRLLHPVIRDEVYRIGREAVVNSLRHSGAKNIEVDLEYGGHELRVIVRDDGCGIDPKVLKMGREGHWGLSGMRERAEKIGAKLSVWSIGGGTEVDLRVPGRIAFPPNSSSKLARWLRFARKTRLEAKAGYAKPGKN
jgi:ligand-binding sensor domain-containing protein